jgi:hypothetical protein
MRTTLSAGSAAGGGSLAMVTILIYLLSLRGIQVPDAVAVAAGSLLTTVFHYLIALKVLPCSDVDKTSEEGDNLHARYVARD